MIYCIHGTHVPEILEFLQFLRPSFAAEKSGILHLPESLREHITELKDWKLEFYHSESPPPIPDEEFQKLHFVLYDPLAPLAPQILNLSRELIPRGMAPARIFTVVDCAAAESSQHAKDYFDACVYYSDVVLLGNRDSVSKKWIRQFQDHFKKMAIPSRFQFLKKGGKTENPEALLFPETRRLSKLFDLPEEPGGISQIQIESSFDLEAWEEDEDEPDTYQPGPEDEAPAKQIPDASSFTILSDDNL